MNVIYIPIEPLAERYTEQWYRNFPPAFAASGFKFRIIDGKPLLDNDIKVGSFLDINSTIHYKMSQLMTIANLFYNGKIKDGDIFFFGDVEFWGLESVRLMADMNGIKIKMVGFLHAASYTIEDAFSIAAPYQQYTETGWFNCLDQIYVGSEYHKDAVIERRLKRLSLDWYEVAQKIIVTKNPIFVDEYDYVNQGINLPKEKKFLLTNRLDTEKRPRESLELMLKLKDAFPDWEFVVTSGRSTLRGTDREAIDLALQMQYQGLLTLKTGLTKAEYHYELSTASIMISHSIEENYGYCIAESILYEVYPVLRRGLSHDEFVGNSKELLFDGDKKDDDYALCCALMNRIELGMEGHVDAEYPLKLDIGGMDNILTALHSLGET